VPQPSVFLVAPHGMTCDGIRGMLRKAVDVKIVGDVADLDAALAALADARCDMVLIALGAAGDAALPSIIAIHDSVPGAVIVVVAGAFDPALVLALIDGRFGGYVVWGTMSLEALHRFLGRELDGDTLPISLAAMAAVVDTLRRPLVLDPRLDSLSPREREVLALVGRGATDGEIAGALTISISTVRTHLRKMHEKLGTETRWQLISLAVRHGLV
jgi:DNA-binding NarL/FixJ family response regulator